MSLELTLSIPNALFDRSDIGEKLPVTKIQKQEKTPSLIKNQIIPGTHANAFSNTGMP